MRSRALLRAIAAAASTWLFAGSAHAGVGDLLGDIGRAVRARAAIEELDVTEAERVLEGADVSDKALAVERARLWLYEGRYDEAAQLLSRDDIAATTEGSGLGDIARGCARAMAATAVVFDEERGVIVHLQDDDDRALAPMLARVASQVRETLIRDLGVALPKPLHVDLVRDQFTLAAMTGLPEKAAQTTGTVAVAKWGRVTMISPRAMEHGYAWLDTLAHEMTHLALTAGTRDKAPLWLQEGVAKREETRWREAQPLDEMPSIDSFAALGLDRGLGIGIDKIGPSIAMLPSSEQAAVAFAEVQSFVRFFTAELGDDALPELVRRIKDERGPGGLERAIEGMSGTDFPGWDAKWREHLKHASRDVPPDLAPGGSFPHAHVISRRLRLGELLHERGRDGAAAIEFGKAHVLAPFEPTIRACFAEALLGDGSREDAAQLVATPDKLHGSTGRWWSLSGLLTVQEEEDRDRSFAIALSLDPLDRFVGCEELTGTALPRDPIRAAVCEAARRAPR